MFKLRNTKIVATLGPASNNLETIQKLCTAGVNVFRLNFSHGLYEDHEKAIHNIRQTETECGRPIAIMLDLQGPKLRIGTFENHTVPLQVHQKFQLDLNETPGDKTRVFFGHPSFYQSLVPGTHILLDDGKVLLRVDEQYSDRVITTVLNGREISDRKGVNLPGVLLEIDAMTQKDCNDLEFGLKLGVDWIAVSFVQSAKDIEQARAKMPEHMKIIAKIEKPLAIQNLDSIIDASDGIMVARGDLGVEVPLEQVPGLQKKILKACHMKGKPVIVATQMLDSMVQAPNPTRAEVSDVANAVYDGADAVMLSAESASGDYPVEAVQMMDRIILEVEKEMKNKRRSYDLPFISNFDASMIAAIPYIVQNSNLTAITVLSKTGTMARRIARERPAVPIITVSIHQHTARYLSLVWGIQAFYIQNEAMRTFDQFIAFMKDFVLKKEIVQANQEILIVTGRSFNPNEPNEKTSTLHLVQV